MPELALAVSILIGILGAALAVSPGPPPAEVCSPECASGETCCAEICLELPSCP